MPHVFLRRSDSGAFSHHGRQSQTINERSSLSTNNTVDGKFDSAVESLGDFLNS